MQDTELNSQTSVTFSIEAGGSPIGGSLKRMSRQVAVMEVAHPVSGLKPSQLISSLVIARGPQVVYSGEAKVANLIDSGTGLVCELVLNEARHHTSLPDESSWQNGLQGQFDAFLSGWEVNARLLPEFKAVVSDFQTLFADLRNWLDQVEAGIAGKTADQRANWEQATIAALAPPITAAINSLVQRFEDIAARLPAEQVLSHQLYLRRQLHPYLLGSPFAMRAYTKPLGYAGDYAMVAMMLRSPAEGKTLFAKLINCWLVSQAPAAAHRHRVAYLKQKLIEEFVRVQSRGRPLRVFNLGCGPADEVQQFLLTEPVSARAKMTLLDFNDETLAHLRDRLNAIQRTTGRGEGVKLVKKSVQQVLKESLRPVRERVVGQYDYVYCAGLFDYLPDEVCKRLMSIFYEMLAPGGLLVATNVSAAMNESFPFRYSMEHMLDWHLIYRDGGDFIRVAPELAAPGDVRVIEEAIGVNIMIEVRRPQHG